MINIREAKTQKVVGETSLFLNTSYKPEYIDILREFSGINFDKKTNTWELPVSYLSKIIDELCIYDSINIKILKDKSNSYNNKLNSNNIKLSKYKTKLFDHQKEGIQFGLSHPKFLLLDEPGLGKSLTSLYIASELKKKEHVEHCLIICGINSLKENWRREVEKHTDLSCTILGEKISKTGKRSIGGVKDRLAHLKRKIDEFYVITNIETLRDNRIIKEINSGKNKFDIIICDEIHTCLPADINVETDRGVFSIKELVENNVECKVKSYSNGKIVYKRIKNRFKIPNQKNLVEFSVEDEFGTLHTLKCTPDHLIFTHNRGFVKAEDVLESDILEID